MPRVESFKRRKTHLKFAGRFATITPFDAFEINSQGMFAVEDISS